MDMFDTSSYIKQHDSHWLCGCVGWHVIAEMRKRGGELMQGLATVTGWRESHPVETHPCSLPTYTYTDSDFVSYIVSLDHHSWIELKNVDPSVILKATLWSSLQLLGVTLQAFLKTVSNPIWWCKIQIHMMYSICVLYPRPIQVKSVVQKSEQQYVERF